MWSVQLPPHCRGVLAGMRASRLAMLRIATVAPAARSPHLYESQFVCTAVPKCGDQKVRPLRRMALLPARLPWHSDCCFLCAVSEIIQHHKVFFFVFFSPAINSCCCQSCWCIVFFISKIVIFFNLFFIYPLHWNWFTDDYRAENWFHSTQSKRRSRPEFWKYLSSICRKKI